MNKTFEQGRNEITSLSQYFATNRQAFGAAGIKEAHVRQSLIDPFFEALGWDVRNAERVAPQYREVIPEDSLDVEGQQKAPDYTFRVGTLPKFYAEAKKCGVNIHMDPAPAYQLRRYGWSAKVAVSILTDFEELSVYDCTLRPSLGDKASRARILFFRFDEYADRWRELWDVFSREAVWSGAFDQYAASKRKRGTSEVDVEFLKEIERWRESLARNMALRNPDLSSDDLNAAVQYTIDRIVFLRMAEDRGLEPEQQLLNLCGETDIYSRFMRGLCRRADEKYNSGLFHFQKEEGVSDAPDRITPKLSVDDRVFKLILQSLYFAHGSPYHFGVMPVEILGTVYERFLGKVIRLTVGHQAKVEEKPEVRKSGGVYYTPAYIVDYIVKETVGRKIEGRSPAQLAGLRNGKQPLRVLDLACGSGSFLLGAYRLLLDHCLNWYVANKPQSHKQAVYNGIRSGQWRLTIEEKKRILTTHIFGVDIDPQAVEVSKLSLLLKVLEGENEQSVVRQLQFFRERALPNLANNIQCGNSLIAPQQLVGDLLSQADEMQRANAFDWKQHFPAAMKAGGFDCVIGNPPYIRIQTMKDWAPLEVEIYKTIYHSARRGNYDIYLVFIERGLQLLQAAGRLGFIVPNKFFRTDYGEGIRRVLSGLRCVDRIVDFGHHQVFSATTYTCLLFLEMDRASSFQYAASEASPESIQGLRFSKRSSKTLTADAWTFEPAETASIVAKLQVRATRLLDLPATVSRGSSSGDDDVFMFERGTVQIEDGVVRTPVFASDFGRYWFAPSGKWDIIFPYALDDGEYRLMQEREFKGQFPRAYAYLRGKEQALRRRKQFKEWYAYSAPRNLLLHDEAQIAVPLLADKGLFARIPERLRSQLCPMASGGFTIAISKECRMKPEFVLGLLNSKLLFWRLRRMSNVFRGGWITCTKQYFAELPIHDIDFAEKADEARHDRIVSLVDSMVAVRNQLAAARSVAQKAVLQRQIDSTDREIDRLVYDLYDLTAEEAELVEADSR
jgi:SAM-dependent methyltransferase